jgi:riboflavin kinase/FMN adenylyltransferase
MDIFHTLDEIPAARPSVVTIGAFDGVHRGHQRLIRSAVEEASANQLQSVVITFDPIPRVVLSKTRVKQLTTADQKAELIRGLGADVLMTLRFDHGLMQMSADGFVGQLFARLALRSLWVGEGFALGANRQGDVTYLRLRGESLGFKVNVLSAHRQGEVIISSTRIRDALQRGDAIEAEACLGRTLLWHTEVNIGAAENAPGVADAALAELTDDAPLLFPMSDDQD